MIFKALLRRAEPLPDSIEIDGRTVPVEIRRSATARRLTLRADAARGAVRVTLPQRMAASRAADFIAGHYGWIAARVAQWPSASPFAAGAIVPVEGIDRVIEWHADRPRTATLGADRILIGGPADGLPGRVERFLKRHALTILAAETEEFAGMLGRKATKVTVRDTASRWGSCSGSGAIAYSWRLILMPPNIRRSIVAHEVAHLVHLNHSADFHALADKLYPHHASANRWLKRHGASVHWVGRG